MNTFFLGFRFEKRGDSYLPVFFLEVWTLLSVSTGDIPVDSSERPGGVRWEAISSYLMILRHQIWHVLSFQLSFFFCRFLEEFAPVVFFRGGVEKNTFFERWQDKTHTFWRKYQRFLTKRSLFERLGLTIWSCLFFFDSKKSSFTMLIHKQSLRSKIFCLPGVTRTEHTLFSLWKKHTLQRLAGNLRPIFWKQHKLYPGCQRLFEV